MQQAAQQLCMPHCHLEDFRKKVEKLLEPLLLRRGPSPLLPTQLVKLFWSLGRLGTRRATIFDAIGGRLRDCVADLSNRELEALYGILTDLELEERL